MKMSWSIVLPASLAVLLAAFAAHSADSAKSSALEGQVVKSEGEVWVVNAQGERHKADKPNTPVNGGDKVETGDNARAVVKFNNDSTSVMTPNSQIQVEEGGWLTQLTGKILYVFRKNQQERTVKTSFATMGVRGTEFLVTATDDRASITLAEGKLEIESPDGQFQRFVEKEQADFEAYMQAQMDGMKAMQEEFKAYQQKQEQEFLEFTERFDLESGKSLSFDGSRVDETASFEEDMSDIDALKAFAGDLLEPR